MTGGSGALFSACLLCDAERNDPHGAEREDAASAAPGSDRARRTLAWAAGLGILADVLLRSMPWGVNAVAWSAAFLAAGWALLPRDAGCSRRLVALALAASCSIVFAWRDSTPLLGGFVALGLTCLAATLLADPLRAGVVRWAVAGVATGVNAVLLPIAGLVVSRRDAPPVGGRRGQALVVLRGLLFALPLLLVLGALFASGDAIFARYLSDALDSVRRLPVHAGVALGAAWVAGGVLYGLGWLDLWSARAGSPFPRRGAGEALVALLLVDLLFLAFLAVQAGALFGGRTFVEATAGLSYAEYARQGFFQLVAACAVALPALLAVDWLVPPGAVVRGRFVGLALFLVVAVGAVLVSAAGRMRLYQTAYGWTEARLFTSAFLAWLGGVWAWLAATILRGRRERFVPGAVLAALAVGWALAGLNPDATIARVAAERAGARPPAVGMDASYVASLGADAVPPLLAAWPRLDRDQRCLVARSLLARWQDGEADWRTWNAARSRARRLVSSRGAELRAALAACPWAAP